MHIDPEPTLPHAARKQDLTPKMKNFVVFFCGAALTLGGCGSYDKQVTLDEPAIVANRDYQLGHGAESRFEGLNPAARAANPAAQAINWIWQAPDHWQPGAGPSSRLATYHPHGNTDVLFTLTQFGGGIRTNFDRWRSQFSLDPLSNEEFASLDMIDALGQRLPIIQLTGSFRDDRLGVAGDDFALLGLVVPTGDGRELFLKMVGPQAAVVAEREAFEAFAASLAAGGAP